MAKHERHQSSQPSSGPTDGPVDAEISNRPPPLNDEASPPDAAEIKTFSVLCEYRTAHDLSYTIHAATAAQAEKIAHIIFAQSMREKNTVLTGVHASPVKNK